MKRLFDLVSSSVAILVFFIPMLVVGICIKLDSKGPILFKQKRIGLNGTIFEIYKFRTMRTDTPNVATDLLGDPSVYITTMGKFLRKTSLDELPQLFNIWKGDMSVVGPRPALYNQYELIEMRNQHGVNAFRPGLTGYAQVMGRDFISDKKKVEYDAFYVNHQGFLLDIKIIWRTIFSVAKADGVKMR